MKVITIFVAVSLVFIAFIFFATVSLAQQPKPAQDVPKYEVQNQETFAATVQEVKDYHCPVSGSLGTHLVLKTATGGTYEAHLAPAAFLKEFDMIFKQGDSVTVTGTKVTFDGKPAVLARLIKVKNETFMFRDEKGRPLW
jgi:DNA/RNA endonuclease YhcR with UshA esterase domain